MSWYNNDYTRTHAEFEDYMIRNGSEPEPDEYDRLSAAVDRAAEVVPWWRRI